MVYQVYSRIENNKQKAPFFILQLTFFVLLLLVLFEMDESKKTRKRKREAKEEKKEQAKEWTIEQKLKKIRTRDSHPEGIAKTPWPEQEADNVIGMDEAGWGPLLGPITVAAAVLPRNCDCMTLHDSKKLTEYERGFAFGWMQSYIHSVVHIHNDEIDRVGMAEARRLGMERALDQVLSQLKTTKKLSRFESWKVMMDGAYALPKQRVEEMAKKYDIRLSMSTVVKGDSKVMQIAAASVLAKFSRDELVSSLDVDSEWESIFKDAKGYGVETHVALIKKGKYTKWHRQTVNPLKTVLLYQ
jgi:ribonuclease HII